MSDGSDERHTFAVLVANEPGVLLRVVGVLAARGYNIESLAVAEVDRERHMSRITLVTSGSPAVIRQIKVQLERLVPVHRVRDLTEDGRHVTLELALVKVAAQGEKQADARRMAESYGGRIVDFDEASAVFEFTDSTDEVDRLIGFMASFGDIEVVRTGTIAISLGPAGI